MNVGFRSPCLSRRNRALQCTETIRTSRVGAWEAP